MSCLAAHAGKPESEAHPQGNGYSPLHPGGDRRDCAAAGPHAHREDGIDHLCLAGGVALNCVANGRLLREGPFKDIWIQPAAGDAGGALGAALAAWHEHLESSDGQVIRTIACRALIWARPTGRRKSPRSWTAVDAVYATSSADTDTDAELARIWLTARWLAGSRGAWNSARVPWVVAPYSVTRAAEACNRLMNLKIKYRESFRPFAPVG